MHNAHSVDRAVRSHSDFNSANRNKITAELSTQKGNNFFGDLSRTTPKKTVAANKVFTTRSFTVKINVRAELVTPTRGEDELFTRVCEIPLLRLRKIRWTLCAKRSRLQSKMK